MAPAKKTRALTYKSAGVNIDRTDDFVERLGELTKATRTVTSDGGRVLSDFRAFSGHYLMDLAGMDEPVLVATTDGVGTKLRVAHLLKRHDTVGIDLVAMCANDLITCGAKPVLFLDYYATGQFRTAEGVAILEGIVEGCKQAGMVLIGGETAEMPGFYKKGEYDLAGFANGLVDRKRIIDGSRIKAGDVVVGVPSSGLHSNGYSLARKVLLDRAKLSLTRTLKGFDRPLGEVLLEPTRIYVKLVAQLLAKHDLKGIAHITGGGLPDNVARLLPAGCLVKLQQERWTRPGIFDLIEKHGKVPRADMIRTFNMGIGLALVVEPAVADRIIKEVRECRIIGHVSAGEAGVRVD